MHPTWLAHGQLQVQRSDLERICDSLPPQVEARVMNIIAATQSDEIILTRGDGPLDVNGADMDAVIESLRNHYDRIDPEPPPQGAERELVGVQVVLSCQRTTCANRVILNVGEVDLHTPGQFTGQLASGIVAELVDEVSFTWQEIDGWGFDTLPDGVNRVLHCPTHRQEAPDR